jgi:hypothetical protein
LPDGDCDGGSGEGGSVAALAKQRAVIVVVVVVVAAETTAFDMGALASSLHCCWLLSTQAILVLRRNYISPRYYRSTGQISVIVCKVLTIWVTKKMGVTFSEVKILDPANNLHMICACEKAIFDYRYDISKVKQSILDTKVKVLYCSPPDQIFSLPIYGTLFFDSKAQFAACNESSGNATPPTAQHIGGPRR